MDLARADGESLSSCQLQLHHLIQPLLQLSLAYDHLPQRLLFLAEACTLNIQFCKICIARSWLERQLVRRNSIINIGVISGQKSWQKIERQTCLEQWQKKLIIEQSGPTRLSLGIDFAKEEGTKKRSMVRAFGFQPIHVMSKLVSQSPSPQKAFIPITKDCQAPKIPVVMKRLQNSGLGLSRVRHKCKYELFGLQAGLLQGAVRAKSVGSLNTRDPTLSGGWIRI